MSVSGDFLLQSGVVALFQNKICLVSSSNQRKWVIPKGNIPSSLGAADSALKECFEEAGVVGHLKPTPVGTYESQKAGQISLVLVYELEVTQILDNWPEIKNRTRAFVTFMDALLLIENTSLQKLLEAVGIQKGHINPSDLTRGTLNRSSQNGRIAEPLMTGVSRDERLGSMEISRPSIDSKLIFPRPPIKVAKRTKVF
jgi:ADP-ribose pyrophosphatase YjhB (NUDIX family)